MHELSEEWSFFTPGQAIYCDRQVSASGRRLEPREAPDRRGQARRCGWFLLTVGRRKIVRIRIAEVGQITGPGDVTRRAAQLDGHSVRCYCGTGYEFETIVIRPKVRSA